MEKWIDLSLVFGFMVALFTGNVGNALIFSGLASVLWSGRRKELDKLHSIGIFIYLIGAVWSIWQPGGLGWFSVCVTLTLTGWRD